MRAVAESFTWPFRAGLATWAIGSLCVLAWPVLFIPLFGYAIAATRAARAEPSGAPPRWTVSGPLLSEGAWTSLAIAVTVLPFALAWGPVASLLAKSIGDPNAHVVAGLVIALPWGLVALLLLPHGVARFAATRDPRRLFDVPGTLRRVRAGFGRWNVVVAAIVTGWTVGLACVGLLCVGLVPGVFYAILVSAHATAALDGQDSPPRAG